MRGYPQNIGVGSMLIALTIAFFPHATAAEFTVDSGVTAVRSLRGNAGVRIEAQLEDPGGLEIQPLENAVRVLLGGCQLSGKPGDPLLPTHKLRLLLPPEGDLRRLTVLVQNPVWEDIEDELDLAPAPPIMRGEGEKKSPSWGEKSSDWIENGRDTRIYHQDEFFPSQIASVIGSGNYRQWKIVEVQIHRMRYNPIQCRSQVLRGGTLVVETSVEDTAVATAPSTTAAPSQVSIDRLHRLIINDADIEEFYPSTATMAAGSEAAGTLRRLAIITTHALLRDNLELVNYIHFKQSKGHTIYVVTEGDSLDATHYRRGYDTFSRASHIRNWLTTYHAQIDSVLLIGNPDPVKWSDSFGVPMILAYPDNGFSPPNPAGLPTDMCYAELSGNWDLDGDGFPGEFIGDFGPGGIDQFCELEVGRIPYYFIDSELAHILRKLMEYEDQLPEDIGYRNKALISAAISNFAPTDNDGDGDLDSLPICCDGPDPNAYVYGDQWGEALKSMAQSHGHSPYTLYEKLGVAHPATPSDAALLRFNLIHEWQKGYGYATWFAHGSAGGAFRRLWEIDDFQPGISNVPMEEKGYLFFEFLDCSQLNDDLRGFAVNLSCDNGRPEDPFNLGYNLLLEGAVGTVTASRPTIYSPGPWQVAYADGGSNQAYGYNIFSAMLDGASLAGALNTARESADYSKHGMGGWANACAYNLYGDPTLTFVSARDPFAARLTLTFPNGAADGTQKMKIGFLTDITWESLNLAGNVAIDLTRDNGLTWETIVASTPNDGYHRWWATGPESVECRFRIRSQDMPHVSDISDAWLTIELPPIPSAPTGVVATNGAFTDRVRVNWNPSADANSYLVYRAVVGDISYVFQGFTVSLTYDDTTASSGVYYNYSVRAMNAAGTSAFSDSDQGYVAITIPIPSTPTGVAASDGTYVDRVHISWTPSTGASFYRIWRALAVPGAWYAEIGTSTVPYYDDTTALQGHTYNYYVVASNAFFNSGNSLSDTGFVALQIMLPTIPTGLSASDGTFNDRVELTWQPSDNAIGYRVSRGLAVPGAWYMEIGTSTVPQYEDTTVEQGKTFSYVVKAFNVLFESNYSEADTGYASIPIALPETPTSLTASDGDFHDKIVLNWNTAENALYYNIYRGVNWNGMILYSLIDDTGNAAYTDTDVYPRITYTYAVTGANGFGESDFSETDTGFLEDCPGDFDFDGDIDGGDLELYIDSGGIDVGAFSGHYGRIDCH